MNTNDIWSFLSGEQAAGAEATTDSSAPSKSDEELLDAYSHVDDIHHILSRPLGNAPLTLSILRGNERREIQMQFRVMAEQ